MVSGGAYAAVAGHDRAPKDSPRDPYARCQMSAPPSQWGFPVQRENESNSFAKSGTVDR